MHEGTDLNSKGLVVVVSQQVVGVCSEIKCLYPLLTSIEPQFFRFLTSFYLFLATIYWKKGKDPHPQDKIQYLDFTKDPRPLYYKTPSCAF